MEVAGTLASVPARPTAESIRRPSYGDCAAAIDIASYLGALAEAILSGLSMTAKVRLRADFQASVPLPLDKAIPLGLIVGELVTNSIKYAHPAGVAGMIKIGSSRRNGAIVIEVSDDGVGLSDSLDPLTSGGSGLRLIRALAAGLGAAISFDNHGLGLSCALRMPYAVAAG
jgi:two-component sensor histidine kinase